MKSFVLKKKICLILEIEFVAARIGATRKTGGSNRGYRDCETFSVNSPSMVITDVEQIKQAVPDLQQQYKLCF